MTELNQFFFALKPLLQGYHPPFTVKVDEEARYELWTSRPIHVAGSLKKEVFFAGLIVQSRYLGFYFMPIYTHPAIKTKLGVELVATLHSKACFRIKSLAPILIAQIETALWIGADCYNQDAWI